MLRLKSLSALGGLILLAALNLCAASANAQVVDQMNIPASFVSGQCYNTSFIGNLPLGQEFTPTLNNLTFVDLYLDDAGADIGPGANFILNIRAGTISNAIIGSSVNTFVPDGTNTGGGNILTRFNFSSPVALTPGNLFVLQLDQVGTIVPGNSNFLLCGDNIGQGGYPRGHAIRGGMIIAADDFWFREGGNITAVPEPGSIALLAGLGVTGSLFAVRRLRRQRK